MSGESGSKNMNWMYEGKDSKVQQEEYLLGKQIDKTFEQEQLGTLGQINAVEYDCTPESIFASRAEHQVDIQRKLQEDPLVAIRKTEIDTRRKLLDNPIKMKELSKYVEGMKKHKKHKKEKKKKKKKHDSDDEDLDALLLQKLERFQPGQQDSKGQRSPSPERKQRSPKYRPRSPSRSPPPRRRRNSSGSPPQRRRRSPSESPPRRRKSPPRRRPSNSPPRRRRSPSGSPPRRRRSRSPARRPSPPRRQKSPPKRRSPPRSKRSPDRKDKDAEREKKLLEMMGNAKWREEQRGKNVKHYRNLDEKEEKEQVDNHDPEFIRKQLSKAAESGTVEGRIKANRYNIQRGKSAMDSNFARSNKEGNFGWMNW